MSSAPPPPPPAARPSTTGSASGDARHGAPDTRPGDDHPVDLTLLDGIVLAVWSLAGQLVIGLMLGIALAVAGVDATTITGPSTLAIAVVVISGTLAGVFAWLAGRGRLTWRLWGPVELRPLVHLAQGVGWGLLAVVTSSLIAAAGQALTGSDDGSGQSLLSEEALSGSSLLLTIALVVLLAPVLEEVCFRGVLFQTVGRRVGWVTGMVVSAVAFAAVHIEIWASGGNAAVFLVALFAVGCVFAVAFNRSRHLLVAVVAHATFNGTQLLIARAVGFDS